MPVCSSMYHLDVSHRVRVILTITQICSGSVSLVASTCIVVIILRSSLGLATPYRRIIFALSLSDVWQSLSIATGPFAVPRDTAQSVLGFGAGTRHTCEMNGFAMVFGVVAVPMYTCLLCYYYYCKLTKNMTDATFLCQVEAKAHVGIVVWNLGVCFFGMITESLHACPLGNICTFSPSPVGCIHHPDIVGKCEQGGNSDVYVILFLGCVPALSLVGVLIITTLNLCHAIEKGRINNWRGEHHYGGRGGGPQCHIRAPHQHNEESIDNHAHFSLSQDNASAIVTAVHTNNKCTKCVKKCTFQMGEHHPCSSQGGDSSATVTVHKKQTTCGVESTFQLEYQSEDHQKEKEHEQKQTCSDTLVDPSMTIGGGPQPVVAMIGRTPVVVGRETTDSCSTAPVATPVVSPLLAAYEEAVAFRVYRREIMLQAILYAASFVLVYTLVGVSFILIVTGLFDTAYMQFVTNIFYPLGGLFNIMIWTRPKVVQLQQCHPSYSYLHALCIVLKAGGELSEEHRPNSVPSSR